tara:strand:- start:6360 stop:7439 length:1080 start_codon:yes stop_codon:yes gene_type:complete
LSIHYINVVKQNKYSYLSYDLVLNRGFRFFTFLIIYNTNDNELIKFFISFESSCFFIRSLFNISLREDFFSNYYSSKKKYFDSFNFILLLSIFLIFLSINNGSSILYGLCFGSLASRIDFYSVMLLKTNPLKSKLIESSINILYFILVLLSFLFYKINEDLIMITKLISTTPLFFLFFLQKQNYSFKIPKPSFKVIPGAFYLGLLVFERIILMFKEFSDINKGNLFVLYMATFLISLSNNIANFSWYESSSTSNKFHIFIVLFSFSIATFGFYFSIYSIILLSNTILISSILIKRPQLAKTLSKKKQIFSFLSLLLFFILIINFPFNLNWLEFSFTLNLYISVTYILIFYEYILYKRKI